MALTLGLPLSSSGRTLCLLSAAKNIAPIHFSEHFETDGASLFKQACELGLEGIISKYKNAPYKSERNESWLKSKCSQTARYEVIGYKNGATSLYLAKRDGKDLVYVGKAGTGFTQSMIIELHKLMKPARERSAKHPAPLRQKTQPHGN
jgi:bifunctional non-homologous end joining protein LigD